MKINQSLNSAQGQNRHPVFHIKRYDTNVTVYFNTPSYLLLYQRANVTPKDPNTPTNNRNNIRRRKLRHT